MKMAKYTTLMLFIPLIGIGAHFLLSAFYATNDLKWMLYLVIFGLAVGGLAYWVLNKYKYPDGKPKKNDKRKK